MLYTRPPSQSLHQHKLGRRRDTLWKRSAGISAELLKRWPRASLVGVLGPAVRHCIALWLANVLGTHKSFISLITNPADLAACRALGETVNRRTGSMGVALSSCTVPAIGRPTLSMAETEMEMGVGIHGEPGRRRMPLASADEVVDQMVGPVLDRLRPKPGEPVLLMVNGFGATPLMELYLVYDAVLRRLGGAVTVARSLVGNYVTSLDMAGCSITLTMLDDETAKRWDAPVHTPGLRWGC